MHWIIRTDQADLPPNPAQHVLKSVIFVSILGLLYRTVLPRKLFLTCGNQKLALTASERRVWPQEFSEKQCGPDGFGRAIAAFADSCAQTDNQISCAVEKTQLIADHQTGYSIGEIVNYKQSQGFRSRGAGNAAEPNDGDYQFDDKFWPISMPLDGKWAALNAAFRASIWMKSWRSRNQQIVGDTVLLVTTSSNNQRQFAVRSAPQLTKVGLLTSESLGRVISAWKV